MNFMINLLCCAIITSVTLFCPRCVPCIEVCCSCCVRALASVGGNAVRTCKSHQMKDQKKQLEDEPH